MAKLPQKQVVTCFVECRGRILLLKRSQQVGSFRGRWAAVSGYIERPADEQSLIEIGEETGLRPQDVTLIKKGESLKVNDTETGVCWVIHPYLYSTAAENQVKTDWEHCDLRWIKPEEIAGFNTVPKLLEALRRVYPP